MVWIVAGSIVLVAAIAWWAWQRRSRAKRAKPAIVSALEVLPEESQLAADDDPLDGLDDSPAIHEAGRTLGFLIVREARSGPPLGQYPVTKSVFTIGRSGKNDLTLHDPSLSRHHAELRYRRDGRFAILDKESLNGVYVNNKRVRAKFVEFGDVLELGDVMMEFSGTGELTFDDATLNFDHRSMAQPAARGGNFPFELSDKGAA